MIIKYLIKKEREFVSKYIKPSKVKKMTDEEVDKEFDRLVRELDDEN